MRTVVRPTRPWAIRKKPKPISRRRGRFRSPSEAIIFHYREKGLEVVQIGVIMETWSKNIEASCKINPLSASSYMRQSFYVTQI
jgi:hypothetical protein